MARIGIDTGGTFTDVVLFDEDDVLLAKTPTTDNLILGVLDGFTSVCDHADVAPEDVEFFSHGHTVALNAVIEDEGADIALLTTDGFRDVLEIGLGARRKDLLYNFFGPRRSSLVPRKHCYEVPERMSPDGEVETPLDMDALDSVIEAVANGDYGGIAVCFLHSYNNSAHEHRVKKRLAECTDDLEVSISSEVSSEIREYRRMATTAVDAYLKPIVSDYLSQLEAEIESRDVSVPLNVMQSDGGVARASIAAERPVKQMISGPVAGVKAAQFVGERIGAEDLITFDMGGTSCDTAIIEGGAPVEEAHREIRGMPINGPFININTAGAGGGSIAWLNESNSLRVGPKSAGSDPGPACYGRGGKRPTVTDADLVLGFLNPTNFAGGTFTLDRDAAEQSIQTHVADPLDMSIEEAALAIRRIIDSKMASTIRVVSVKKGNDPREFALIGYGGAGPVHACSVAAQLDIETVIFPSDPGVMSAFGLLLTDITHNHVQSVVETVDEVEPRHITDVIRDLIERGADELTTEEVDPDRREFRISFDMMYSGQSHYLNVPVGVETSSVPDQFRLTADMLSTVVDSFEQQHDAMYGFTDNSAVELVNVRVMAVGMVPDLDLAGLTQPSSATDSEDIDETRRVRVDDDSRPEVPCYQWDSLAPGQMVDGPAIIELDNSTIWVAPEFDGRIDQYMNVILER